MLRVTSNGVTNSFRSPSHHFLKLKASTTRAFPTAAWLAGMIAGLTLHKSSVVAYAQNNQDLATSLSFSEPIGWSRANFQVRAFLYIATGKLEVSYSCHIPTVDQWSRIITYHRPDCSFGLVCQLKDAKGNLLENFSLRTDPSGKGIHVFDVKKEILENVGKIILLRG